MRKLPQGLSENSHRPTWTVEKNHTKSRQSGSAHLLLKIACFNLAGQQPLNLVEMFSRQFSEFIDNTRMLLLSESALGMVLIEKYEPR
jgi:hypothetical protein